MNPVLDNWIRTLRTHVDPDEKFFLLHPGAAAKDVEEWRAGLQQYLSIEAPGSVVELLLHSDGERLGSAGLFFGLTLLSVQDMFRTYSELRAGEPYDRPSARSNPPDAIKYAWFNRRWLPFARDSGGSYLALDFDPGPAGTAGQVITMGTEESTQSVVARSFDDFLIELTGLIESGNFLLANGKLQLKDPPLKHFLDRHHPALVEQARRLGAHPDPSLRAELVPERPTSLNLNEGAFGSPPPDLRRVASLVISTRPGELWKEWRFEDNRKLSEQLPTDPSQLEARFQQEVEAWKAKGFSLAESTSQKS